MNEPNTKQQPLSGLPITFQLYAHNEQEIEDARTAIVAFIEQHRRCGRAVTASKVAQAIARWDQNPIVKSQIIKYFT
jgi:hypothetical protein